MENLEKVMSFLESVDNDLDYLIEYLEQDEDYLLSDELLELSELITKKIRKLSKVRDYLD